MAAASAPVDDQQAPADTALDPELGHTPQAASAAATLTAVFGTPEEEVARLTRTENLNYYAVLKVEPDDLSTLKRHYFKLSRLVHPDKCSSPDAGRAMAVVSTAYDVLNTPMKKKLYDAYATQEKPEDMSYAQWEAQQVEIPIWVQRVLRVPGGGCCLLVCLIPVLLIVALVLLVVWIICLPFHLCIRLCGVKPLTKEEAAARAAAQHEATAADPAAATHPSERV